MTDRGCRHQCRRRRRRLRRPCCRRRSGRRPGTRCRSLHPAPLAVDRLGAGPLGGALEGADRRADFRVVLCEEVVPLELHRDVAPDQGGARAVRGDDDQEPGQPPHDTDDAATLDAGGLAAAAVVGVGLPAAVADPRHELVDHAALVAGERAAEPVGQVRPKPQAVVFFALPAAARVADGRDLDVSSGGALRRHEGALGGALSIEPAFGLLGRHHASARGLLACFTKAHARWAAHRTRSQARPRKIRHRRSRSKARAAWPW